MWQRPHELFDPRPRTLIKSHN